MKTTTTSSNSHRLPARRHALNAIVIILLTAFGASLPQIVEAESITRLIKEVSREASISGSIFDDRNGNSLWDGGESGTGGVLVTLLDKDYEPVASTTTNADGLYKFAMLRPALYRPEIKFESLSVRMRGVRVEAPEDYTINPIPYLHQGFRYQPQVSSTVARNEPGVTAPAEAGSAPPVEGTVRVIPDPGVVPGRVIPDPGTVPGRPGPVEVADGQGAGGGGDPRNRYKPRTMLQLGVLSSQNDKRHRKVTKAMKKSKKQKKQKKSKKKK